MLLTHKCHSVINYVSIDTKTQVHTLGKHIFGHDSFGLERHDMPVARSNL